MGLWSRYVLPRLVESACKSREILDERRRWVPRAHGRVLEIGVGSGLNLAFYDAARVESVTGIDPSSELLARCAPRARAAPVPVLLVAEAAERLSFPAGAFDTAVVTYSLCSVHDPVRALEEVRRVLVPRGELFFVEHGLARDPEARAWQRRLSPAWSRVGGGCRLDRDLPRALAEAGFTVDELTAEYGEGPRWLSYTYQGSARCARPAPTRAADLLA